ncbi:MAG: 23S rRNA (adenine(2030)-N(6))-methyltransferase RlmJ [Betaproteobacteria bacterium]|jgi:23S rRNA (adenine2030-N6)-methyltransferase|nr:23S rRNA (adenine(2030)-N(6))-methyltransferase RlmJ [Betaproteobacteria bacterium]NBT10842.1 23S rRNA (adenine(2030)-N(6))-methyltransferase RlmJ [Betaproteobacteria bacterium]NBU49823.1 23S rRNA (adenine(2030)-N(6))-methyltransferase RlmJ [Betaproteobacteria bacterium]NBX96210.1 23S rRNA (adenine(2030)-N(6))-methyltransferase RlmJ [Betaproteobacteria bacterium]
MFAYRHAFHAGNHGDVLKHLVLSEVLRHMGEKDKPYTVLDTHAGAGGYSLQGRYAEQTGEFQSGVAALWSALSSDPAGLPGAVQRYLQLVRDFNGGAGAALRQYPGSPAIAQALMRPSDPLRLYEMHPTDERILRAFLGGRPHTQVHLADGFASLARELPPPSRRGVVLIDPSYELKADYGKVVAAVRDIMTRFAQAVVIVWYPLVQLVEAVQLPKRLRTAAAAAPKGWLDAHISVQAADKHGFGMMGSGVFLINPPHGIHDMLQECLPLLAQRLSQIERPKWALDAGLK